MKKQVGTQTSTFGTSDRENHNASKFYNSRLYKDLKLEKVLNQTENTLPQTTLNEIFCRSAENMIELPDRSIHLMITSPPYNVSKEYDADLSLEEYLNLLEKVLQETYRVLVNGGRACINVANLGRKPYIPLAEKIISLMSDLGYNMRGEIIWNKAAGAGSSTAWGSCQSASNPTLRDVHEYILIFSKGDYKRTLEPQQKIFKKNTISKDHFMAWTKSIWIMNPESAKKVGHPAPFPIELPRRLIELYSFTKDVILDPFMGSGSTALAALKLDRYFVGYELEKSYVKLAKQRLAGSLKPLNFD